MSFCRDHQVLSLIKNQDNERAKALIKNGNLCNAVDSQKNTLLHYAAEYQNPEIARFLIDSGSKVDAKNEIGQTPLIKSLESDLPCKRVIEILLRAGANVYMKNNAGKRLFETVNCFEWLNEDARRFEILKVFIEHDHFLSSFSVFFEGNKDFIEKLLQTNLNLSVADGEGTTVVHMLAMNCNPGVIELLSGKNFDVNVVDSLGRTPLMHAVNFCNIGAVEFLLSMGADVEAIDFDGESALYKAIDHHRKDVYPEIKRIVQVLLEHGANVQIQITRNRGTIIAYNSTVFDFWIRELPEWQELKFQVTQLLLAHLALQKRHGTTITDLIRITINAVSRFKNYFEYCQQQLSVSIYSSFTLFDLLTASDTQFERFFPKEDLISGLINLHTEVEYFDTILNKRLSKANRIIKLRIGAAQIVCKLIQIDYDCYPFIIDVIVNYMDEKDHEYLISIENEIF